MCCVVIAPGTGAVEGTGPGRGEHDSVVLSWVSKAAMEEGRMVLCLGRNRRVLTRGPVAGRGGGAGTVAAAEGHSEDDAHDGYGCDATTDCDQEAGRAARLAARLRLCSLVIILGRVIRTCGRLQEGALCGPGGHVLGECRVRADTAVAEFVVGDLLGLARIRAAVAEA